MASTTSVDDLELPKSALARICKGVLPDGTMLNKDAKQAISRGATIFINYLTAMAQEVAAGGTTAHKSIGAEDVLNALEQLDLEAFVPHVRTLLQEHRQTQTVKRQEQRRRSRAGKQQPADAGVDESNSVATAHNSGADDDGDGEDYNDDVELDNNAVSEAMHVDDNGGLKRAFARQQSPDTQEASSSQDTTEQPEESHGKRIRTDDSL